MTEEVDRMVSVLEDLINSWLGKGYRYVWIKPDGSCLPVLPEMDFDIARNLAKDRGYEMLSLADRSTQARVGKWLLDGWVQDAREEGQRELAQAMSALPGKGGSS